MSKNVGLVEMQERRGAGSRFVNFLGRNENSFLAITYNSTFPLSLPW